ncbi:MAG: acetolactate synthase, partial [Opitutae bacterium]|nr:acetolactate synthase [Opitutae bacterium]
PFLTWPNDRPVLAIGLEDEDIAIDVLTRNNLRVLSQEDLAR